MTSVKPPKKTDTIEIRLPDAAKAAFMDHCRAQDRTASEAIRRFIDDQIAPRPAVRRAPPWRVALAGMIGIALGMGVAAPSLARATHNTRAVFDQLDRNHDGALSATEFQAR